MWRNHVEVCRQRMMEEMEREMERKREIEDEKISKEKYKILQRFHKQQTDRSDKLDGNK